METVPPVPDACEEEVLEAQSKLIDIAQGIETVFVEINWLRGPFEDSCLELEPELEAVMNKTFKTLTSSLRKGLTTSMDSSIKCQKEQVNLSMTSNSGLTVSLRPKSKMVQ
jgi:hypothetical protein